MQTHTRQHRPSQMSTTLDTSSDDDDEDGASGDDGEPRGLNDAAATSPSHDGEGVSVIGLGASATTPGAAAGHFELPGSGSPPPPSTTTVESPTVPALPPRPVLSAAEGVSAFAAMWESDQFKASAAAPRDGNTCKHREWSPSRERGSLSLPASLLPPQSQPTSKLPAQLLARLRVMLSPGSCSSGRCTRTRCVQPSSPSSTCSSVNE